MALLVQTDRPAWPDPGNRTRSVLLELPVVARSRAPAFQSARIVPAFGTALIAPCAQADQRPPPPRRRHRSGRRHAHLASHASIAPTASAIAWPAPDPAQYRAGMLAASQAPAPPRHAARQPKCQ